LSFWRASVVELYLIHTASMKFTVMEY